MSHFRAGVPCWAGLRSPDLAASNAFYCGLFGWEVATEPNGYVLYSLHGRAVAGAGPLFDESQPPAWCTYIGVVDADATVAAATQAGAGVAVEPFDVPGYGRVGVVTDPAGAEVWIWQPDGFEGAELVEEPGSVYRWEYGAVDTDFYQQVFGLRPLLCCDAIGWGVRFAVEDAAATAAKVATLGGKVVTSNGDAALLSDIHGGRFSVSRVSSRGAP